MIIATIMIMIKVKKIIKCNNKNEKMQTNINY